MPNPYVFGMAGAGPASVFDIAEAVGEAWGMAAAKALEEACIDGQRSAAEARVAWIESAGARIDAQRSAALEARRSRKRSALQDESPKCHPEESPTCHPEEEDSGRKMRVSNAIQKRKAFDELTCAQKLRIVDEEARAIRAIRGAGVHGLTATQG